MNSQNPGGGAAIGALATEARNPRTMRIDTLDTVDLLALMNAEDRRVPDAVATAIPEIARAVDAVAAARARGGRLVYLGAGTSGRIGLLDAVECPPTFGIDPSEVLGLIAGGDMAFVRAVEGAEDDEHRGVADLTAHGIGPDDVVVGLAASGRTPYVIGGLRYARSVGAATVAVSCTPSAAISAEADIAIEVLTGPEALTGSTRLKAGTAQKLVCNMISTGSMIRTGKVYENLMVDVRPTNVKLKDRARRIVTEATGVSDERAAEVLDAAGEHPKTAIVMILADCDAERAAHVLARANGAVRDALALAEEV